MYFVTGGEIYHAVRQRLVENTYHVEHRYSKDAGLTRSKVEVLSDMSMLLYSLSLAADEERHSNDNTL